MRSIFPSLLPALPICALASIAWRVEGLEIVTMLVLLQHGILGAL